MLNGLDLFSGIGGITVALSPWVSPVAYCESDRFAQGILLSRMATGELPWGPIWDDVRTLHKGCLLQTPDVIYGGFPCQPYSSASRGRKAKCEYRKEFARLVNEIKPGIVFAENTTLEAVHGLAELLDGYDAKICANSAAEVGRPFIGRRYWMVAKTNSNGKPIITIDDEMGIMQTPSQVVWEETTPENIRVDDGVPNRMDRARALGNAVVPLQARKAFGILSGFTR